MYALFNTQYDLGTTLLDSAAVPRPGAPPIFTSNTTKASPATQDSSTSKSLCVRIFRGGFNYLSLSLKML